MDRPRRLLIVIAAAGLGVVGLSFVDAWLVHDREVLGEGYRRLHLDLDAWRLAAVPVLSAGIVAALVTAAGAVVAWARDAAERASTPILVGSVLTLALVGATLVPVGVERHATSLHLAPGWAAWAGVGLAVVMVVAAGLLSAPSGRVAAALGVAGLVLLGATAGGRWLGLELDAGSGQHWSDGTYARATSAGEQTLTIAGGRFEIDDRWSGTWESSGWTVVLAGDPACPDARGTYHAHGEGELGEDLRFVKVVDTCRDGQRAADMEDGPWLREP